MVVPSVADTPGAPRRGEESTARPIEARRPHAGARYAAATLQAAPLAKEPAPAEPEPARFEATGPFRLVRRLGAGGFAPVYLAEEVHDRRKLREVALKLFFVPEALAPGSA